MTFPIEDRLPPSRARPSFETAYRSEIVSRPLNESQLMMTEPASRLLILSSRALGWILKSILRACEGQGHKTVSREANGLSCRIQGVVLMYSLRLPNKMQWAFLNSVVKCFLPLTLSLPSRGRMSPIEVVYWYGFGFAQRYLTL
jgi:hypothetical protein